MKKFMITGGLLGFSIGLVSGFLQECDGPSVLWRASVAAFVAGILMRWWGRLWAQSVQEVCEQRLAAREQANNNPAFPVASKP